MDLDLEPVGSSIKHSTTHIAGHLKRGLTNKFQNDLTNNDVLDRKLKKKMTARFADSFKGQEGEDDEQNPEKEMEDLFDKDEENMGAGMTNEGNMYGYINKYGQTFELPSYYIIDSTIFPRTSDEQTTYTLTLVAFGVPNVTN